jgi:hypothetical protein
MPTITDFSGVLVVKAPSATAANNAAGKDIIVQSNHFVSLGAIKVQNTDPAQNELIQAYPKFPFSPKIIKNAVKAAGATWTAGQTLYIVAADGSYTATKGTNLVGGIAAADAASAATVGDVIPAVVNVTAV